MSKSGFVSAFLRGLLDQDPDGAHCGLRIRICTIIRADPHSHHCFKPFRGNSTKMRPFCVQLFVNTCNCVLKISAVIAVEDQRAVWRIQNVLMWIRIPLFMLMRIRIRIKKKLAKGEKKILQNLQLLFRKSYKTCHV